MIQLGMTNAENKEKPKMNMFLEEFMSVYLKKKKRDNWTFLLASSFEDWFKLGSAAYLHVWNSRSTDDTKSHKKHSSNHRSGNSGEDGSNFANDPHQNHEHSTQENHSSAANLSGRSHC